MKNMKRVSISVLLSLSMLLFLINCGGSGDGGGGLSYEGAESQVVINESNAEAVATSTYENSTSMRSMGETGGIFGAVSVNGNGQVTKPYGVTLARFVRDFLVQADSSSESGNHVMAAVGSESMPGECGGSATISGTVSEETGSFDIRASFSSYCNYEDGSTGTVTVNGTMNMEGSLQSDSLQANLTFSNIEITQSDTGVSETASGTMYMEMDMSSESALIRMTMVVRDESTDKTYKVENLVISFDSSTLSINGRFYDPDYGYVDIELTAEFQLNVNNDAPESGTMIITGAGSTKAKLIFVSSTQYQVQADTNGDDVYDYVPAPKDW